MRLEDKVAIVTGGSRDIGRAISIKLAAEGARVVVNYFHDKAAAEETLGEIEAAGGTGMIVQADVTKADEVTRMITQTREAYGNTIHILANVAGGMVARKPLAEMDEAFLGQVMALNLNSTFLMTQGVVPFMPKGGSIVNLASQAGRDGGGPGASAYAASKAAVTTFTRAMAKELGPSNIRVNAVSPGMISTSFHDTFTVDQVRQNVANATPLRREGRADEIADLVAYLASDEASFIQGANIDINGGLLLA